MDARTRILTIRLMEAMGKDPGYAQSIGMEAELKKRLTSSMNSYLHAEGLTEL